LITNAIYLEDSGITIEGLKIWGSPISPNYHSWAFNCERGEEIRKHWDLIPEDTDILITHCPPFGILDFDPEGKPKGCEDLLTIIQQKVKPRLHIFGHLHDAHGQIQIGETLFVNASMVNTVSYPKWLKIGRNLTIRIFQVLKNILPTKKPIRLNRKAYESQMEVVYEAVEVGLPSVD
jgi:Icc-related predicted phosphoesterase